MTKKSSKMIKNHQKPLRFTKHNAPHTQSLSLPSLDA